MCTNGKIRVSLLLILLSKMRLDAVYSTYICVQLCLVYM